jgi:hypothetical protein
LYETIWVEIEGGCCQNLPLGVTKRYFLAIFVQKSFWVEIESCCYQHLPLGIAKRYYFLWSLYLDFSQRHWTVPKGEEQRCDGLVRPWFGINWFR